LSLSANQFQSAAAAALLCASMSLSPERARLKPAARKKAVARQRVHQQLRIISGTAAGRRLRSPQGDQVRACGCVM